MPDVRRTQAVKSITGHFGSSSIAAKLHWPDGGASLNWRRGHPPEFERTIDMAALPDAIRSKVERLAEGASRIVCESVTHWGDRGYEITIFRDGAASKYKV